MRIDLITLFPDMCNAYVNESIIGRAQRAGKIEINCHHLREHTIDKFRRVDDSPFGGGMGMLLTADPLARACDFVIDQIGERPHIVYLSPKGRVLTQEIANELATYKNLLLVCGHYEGVDERFLDLYCDEEISLGDFVLTGGELAALAVCDSVARVCEGVLKNDLCFEDESHFNGLLEYPQYTRPAVWRDLAVPEVLTSGHHANIRRWQRNQSLIITRERRPDMFEKIKLDKADLKFLREYDENARNASQCSGDSSGGTAGTVAQEGDSTSN